MGGDPLRKKTSAGILGSTRHRDKAATDAQPPGLRLPPTTYVVVIGIAIKTRRTPQSRLPVVQRHEAIAVATKNDSGTSRVVVIGVDRAKVCLPRT